MLAEEAGHLPRAALPLLRQQARLPRGRRAPGGRRPDRADRAAGGGRRRSSGCWRRWTAYVDYVVANTRATCRWSGARPAATRTLRDDLRGGPPALTDRIFRRGRAGRRVGGGHPGRPAGGARLVGDDRGARARLGRRPARRAPRGAAQATRDGTPSHPRRLTPRARNSPVLRRGGSDARLELAEAARRPRSCSSAPLGTRS